MIEIRNSFKHLSKDELNQLLDLPVWLALHAAYQSGGRVTSEQRRQAVKLTYLRTFTSSKTARELYRLLHRRFALRYDKLDSRLPLSVHDKLLYLKAQIRLGGEILHKLDEDIERKLRESLQSFYKRLFSTNKSVFQIFSLPVFSGHLEQKQYQKEPLLNAV